MTKSQHITDAGRHARAASGGRWRRRARRGPSAWILRQPLRQCLTQIPYAAIEAHRAAVFANREAVRIEFSYEEEAGCVRNMNAKQRQNYEALAKATEAAWG